MVITTLKTLLLKYKNHLFLWLLNRQIVNQMKKADKIIAKAKKKTSQNTSENIIPFKKNT